MANEWRKPSEPRTIAAQEASIKVLELLAKSPEGTENVEKACRQVERSYQRTGGKSPVAFSTLRKYADGGIIIHGYPELAKPFLEVVPLVRSGEIKLKDLGGGGMSLMIREGALDQACEVAKGMLEMPEALKTFAKQPHLLSAMIARLGEVVKLEKGVVKQADVFELLEGINEEEAMRAIGVIFKRFPKIGADLVGGNGG